MNTAETILAELAAMQDERDAALLDRDRAEAKVSEATANYLECAVVRDDWEGQAFKMQNDRDHARAEAAANAARLRWLILNSSLDDSEGQNIVLIVTQRAVPKCHGTHLPEYHAAVLAAIDAAISIRP